MPSTWRRRQAFLMLNPRLVWSEYHAHANDAYRQAM